MLFYDGAECLRPLEPNPRAAARPRGYSCEELGGALWGPLDEPADLRRLSRVAPLFVSPHGTGCSRYLSTLWLEDALVAFWQQGQPDGSQPLVSHRQPEPFDGNVIDPAAPPATLIVTPLWATPPSPRLQRP